MPPKEPPNIDELGNLALLRQALDILRAPEDVQRSLYPEQLDVAREMTDLFLDAWQRVRPVFEPILGPETLVDLLDIESNLRRPSPDWPEIRRVASRARQSLPGRTTDAPRPYTQQLVRARNRLLLRSQLT